MEGREMYTEKRKKANIKVENQKETDRQADIQIERQETE